MTRINNVVKRATVGKLPKAQKAIPGVLHKISIPVPLPNPDSAAGQLGRAAAIMQERGKQYDKPEGERSMAATIKAFNAITGRDLSESEGWILMQVLKLVRSQNTVQPHRDSVEDNVAYSSLFAEARLAGK